MPHETLWRSQLAKTIQKTRFCWQTNTFIRDLQVIISSNKHRDIIIIYIRTVECSTPPRCTAELYNSGHMNNDGWWRWVYFSGGAEPGKAAWGGLEGVAAGVWNRKKKLKKCLTGESNRWWSIWQSHETGPRERECDRGQLEMLSHIKTFFIKVF